MNAQLASWAELRHDTLLYAKQSYTAVPVCDFPDAYVDPYPEAWAASLVRQQFARLGQALRGDAAHDRELVTDSDRELLRQRAQSTVSMLQGMAEASSAQESPSPPTRWRSSTRPSRRRR